MFYQDIGIKPGPGVSAHAAVEEECSACHAEIDHPSLVWTKEILNSGLFSHSRQLQNSERCLSCHTLGDTPLLPHGTTDPAIASIANQGEARTAWSTSHGPNLETRLAGNLLASEFKVNSQIGNKTNAALFCAVCHRSHEGRDFDPTVMRDAQCQVCHAEGFDGFVSHPPFHDYPYSSIPSVQFDHQSHFTEHFSESAQNGIAQPESCAGCHTSDVNGEFKVSGFEACASCHERDITDPKDELTVVKFLAPPSLDLGALANSSIGGWPQVAASEPNAYLLSILDAGGYLDSAELKQLQDLDLTDLGDADELELRSVVRFAWAFKSIVRDLLQEGSIHSVGAGEESRANLTYALPFELIERAASFWFPNLQAEFTRYDAGKDVQTQVVRFDLSQLPQPQDVAGWSRLGGWHMEEAALLYRPAGHADSFAKAWLELALSNSSTNADMVDLLTESNVLKTCAKCHVARSELLSRPRLSWYARGSLAPLGSNNMTYILGAPGRHLKPFSHVNHRQAIVEDGCTSCHQINDSTPYIASSSGFNQLSESTCVQCHNKEGQLDSCLTCHEYHFELDFGTLLDNSGRISFETMTE